MFGLFNRRIVLQYIISFMEARIGSYDWLVNLTLKEMFEIMIVIKDMEDEKKITESRS